jgi:predicted permease
MYKEILRGIAGIGIFPVVSLVLFVLVFSAAVLRAFCMDRAGVDYLAGLPLDERESAAAGTEGRP